MRVTTKVRYGLRAILQIAEGYGGPPVPISAIAHSQEVSGKYLEQLVGMLRKKQLIVSRKGVRGGYLLNRPPAEITLWEVINALDGDSELVDCCADPSVCDRSDFCSTRAIWGMLGEQLRSFWGGFTLQDMLDRIPALDLAAGESAAAEPREPQ